MHNAMKRAPGETGVLYQKILLVADLAPKMVHLPIQLQYQNSPPKQNIAAMLKYHIPFCVSLPITPL